MDAARLIDRLERFAGILPAAVAGLPAEDARWKPPDGAWSVLEIVAHMADEEVEDFRRRLELTLRDPAEPWPSIDPEGWAKQRRYNDGRLDEAVGRFADERRRSVQWLRTLVEPAWSNAFQHKSGPISAGDLLTSWAAHDALHLRQIAKRMYQLIDRDGGAHSAAYAGRW